MEKCKQCGKPEKSYFLYEGLCDKCSLPVKEKKFQASLHTIESFTSAWKNVIKQ